MATILKVHGTFASGPEEGDKWWQRGSECCNHVGELVEAEDGNLKIEQVIWDGLNSERSRQGAAAMLLNRMGELEKAGEPYCVVGHSHGGSVISAALLRAAFYNRPLEKLSRWITIGTPFIEAKRSWLFARLGPGGKTVFLSALAMTVAGLLMGAETRADGVGFFEGNLFKIVSGMLGVLIVGLPVLWILARNRLYWHDRHAKAAASKAFSTRWLSLRHEDDEAVQGLGAFQAFKHPIFPREFAVDSLSRLAIFVVPLAIYFALMGIAKLSGDDPAVPPSATTAAQPAATQTGPQSPLTASKSGSEQARPDEANAADAVSSAPPKQNDTRLWRWFAGAGLAIGAVIFFAIGAAIFIGIPIAMYNLVHWVARPTSRALSVGLNRMTWSQLRRSSLGSDIDGEVAQHARASPIWVDTQCPPLPRPLATEISIVSDAAAGNSIAKFRAALSELGFYRLQDGGRDALNAFLTGDELIHTTYFKIPRFRKLLAYSIAKSPGFRPSAALSNDPDFPLIEQWYKELTEAPQEAASPAVATPQAAPALPV